MQTENLFRLAAKKRQHYKYHQNWAIFQLHFRTKRDKTGQRYIFVFVFVCTFQFRATQTQKLVCSARNILNDTKKRLEVTTLLDLENKRYHRINEKGKTKMKYCKLAQ